MDAPLCGTQVTGKIIMDLLISSPQIDISDHRINEVKGEILADQGYSSVVFRVRLTWSSSEIRDRLPESVIVKAIGTDSLRNLFDLTRKEKLNEIKHQLKCSHSVECAVYGLAELGDKVPTAACYGFTLSTDNDLGIIILEDLTNKGVLLPKSVTFGNGLNSYQLENLLVVLTDLHAWSSNTTIDWRTHLPSVNENALCMIMEDFREELPDAKNEYPHVLENLDEVKVSKLMTRANYVEHFHGDPRIKYNLPLVLVHGNIQLLNMLFKLNSRNEPGNEICALLDWQLAHPGCGIEDLVALLSWCVSIEVRRESENTILQRYVELFNKKVQKTENRISFENAKQAYEEMFSFNGLSYGCGIVAMTSTVGGTTNLTDEKREDMKRDLISRLIANYEDSIKILHW